MRHIAYSDCYVRQQQRACTRVQPYWLPLHSSIGMLQSVRCTVLQSCGYSPGVPCSRHKARAPPGVPCVYDASGALPPIPTPGSKQPPPVLHDNATYFTHCMTPGRLPFAFLSLPSQVVLGCVWVNVPHCLHAHPCSKHVSTQHCLGAAQKSHVCQLKLGLACLCSSVRVPACCVCACGVCVCVLTSSQSFPIDAFIHLLTVWRERRLLGCHRLYVTWGDEYTT